MDKTICKRITAEGKSLNLVCASFHGDDVPVWLYDEVAKIFETLVPHIKNEEQVLYIRDIQFLAIKGTYAGGHCYNEYEAMIAVPDWSTSKEQLLASINHELHHMARWQNAGYGETLGGALLSEGIATFYEALKSGWTSPWAKATFNKDAIDAATKAWDDNAYNHGEWFFDGPLGEWVGYGIGYALAAQLFKDDFDLARSVSVTPAETRHILVDLLHS